jgi:multidrug efflux pump subunit AcrA (membrane-fusion protein)
MKSRILIILIMAGFLAAGCQKKDAAKTDLPQAVPIKAVQVELKDISKTLEYIGSIKANEEANVYPKVTGKIIEKVKEDGMTVEKGDTIAYVDRDEIGLKYEKAPVTSPLTGIVGRFYSDIGSNVSPQTPVALVIDMDKVKIGLDISEKYLADISLEQRADIYVDAYPGQKFTGIVTKISPVLDTETRSMPVEITIDNKGHKLKSGMFARASLIIKEIKLAPVVLKEAVMGKEPDVYVYVINGNKAALKNIKTGMRQNGYFEVVDGLKQGDLVVIMGQQKLKDGVIVKMELSQ